MMRFRMWMSSTIHRSRSTALRIAPRCANARVRGERPRSDRAAMQCDSTDSECAMDRCRWSVGEIAPSVAAASVVACGRTNPLDSRCAAEWDIEQAEIACICSTDFLSRSISNFLSHPFRPIPLHRCDIDNLIGDAHLTWWPSRFDATTAMCSSLDAVAKVTNFLRLAACSVESDVIGWLAVVVRSRRRCRICMR
jgi:hypothetical protein